jgi:hypothetical protein
MCSYCFSQVGINTVNPEGALDVASSTSGFVPPRVQLTSISLAAPVVNPNSGSIPPGTIVWNIAAAGTAPTNVGIGLYYWDGSRWVSFAGSPGGVDWTILGNTNTNTTDHHFGTKDHNGVIFKTDSKKRMELTADGKLVINNANYTDNKGYIVSVNRTVGVKESAIIGMNNENGYGVFGKAKKTGKGIYGYNVGGTGEGVYGYNNKGGIGVYGKNDGSGIGIKGEFTGNASSSSVGSAIGVNGVTNRPEGYGVLGENTATTGSPLYGVYSNEEIGSTGTKTFRIDHPQDPANKYLLHYSIESNEVLNMYRGTEQFNAEGKATVKLPSYFESINKDTSYQLTPIGAAMPNLFISKEIKNGVFEISGGIPGKKVSWQIMAKRNDLYIRNRTIQNEVEKSDFERGKYLKPALYNQPKEKGIFYRKK